MELIQQFPTRYFCNSIECMIEMENGPQEEILSRDKNNLTLKSSKNNNKSTKNEKTKPKHQQNIQINKLTNKQKCQIKHFSMYIICYNSGTEWSSTNEMPINGQGLRI